MQTLGRKLKRFQPLMRTLNRRVTEGIQNIQRYRENLAQAQQRLNEDLFNSAYLPEITHWQDFLEKTSADEEKLLMQKAKVNWLQLGDGNNAYLHAIVKGKNNNNSIHKLVKKNGNIITEPKDMETEVIQFCEALVGTSANSLKHMDIEALRRGRQLQENI